MKRNPGQSVASRSRLHESITFAYPLRRFISVWKLQHYNTTDDLRWDSNTSRYMISFCIGIHLYICFYVLVGVPDVIVVKLFHNTNVFIKYCVSIYT